MKKASRYIGTGLVLPISFCEPGLYPTLSFVSEDYPLNKFRCLQLPNWCWNQLADLPKTHNPRSSNSLICVVSWFEELQYNVTRNIHKKFKRKFPFNIELFKIKGDS